MNLIKNKKYEIANSVQGLMSVLNEIKDDYYEGCLKHTFTKRQFENLLNDNRSPNRYRTFYILKKNGGKREIKAPSKELMVILNCIKILLQSIYKPSECAMGFVPCKSVVDNAAVHVGHNYVYNIDLQDFFPTISQPRVWKRLQLPPFNFDQDTASIIAGLCCSYDESRKQNVLPQGAPTSPILSNAICDNLDRRLRGVARRFGLHYTRYADDITFSSMHNVYQREGLFIKELNRIIEQQGFKINVGKVRLLHNWERQEVTGITVNKKVNVQKKYVSDLRWIINLWEKKGYAKAYASFYIAYKQQKRHIKLGEPIMENVINGKLNYLKNVKGDTNPTYQRLRLRFESLISQYHKTKTDDIYYIQEYSFNSFCKLFNAQIYLTLSNRNNVYGICIGPEFITELYISKKSQLTLKSSDKLALSKLIKLDNNNKDRCLITLCNKKGKNFWLMTFLDTITI